MVAESDEQEINNQYNNSVLELIHDDANESLKLLLTHIISINTRLTLLIGFNATFASLLPKLPVQSYFSIKYPFLQEFTYLYPYAEPFIKIPVDIINWLLSIKPLIAISIAFSLVFAIFSVLPSPIPYIIFPNKMLNKSEGYSVDNLRKAIIKNRDETIQRFQNLINKKASNLKYALIALGIAAILTVFDILTNINIQPNN